MHFDRIIQQLKEDEGFSPKAYWDNDQWTYGYGTKAPDGDATITEERAHFELVARVHVAISDYWRIFKNYNIDNAVREEALVNMVFNLGFTKLRKFKKMIAAIADGNWILAAKEAKDSAWYKQVGKRAQRIVCELALGEKNG